MSRSQNLNPEWKGCLGRSLPDLKSLACFLILGFSGIVEGWSQLKPLSPADLLLSSDLICIASLDKNPERIGYFYIAQARVVLAMASIWEPGELMSHFEVRPAATNIYIIMHMPGIPAMDPHLISGSTYLLFLAATNVASKLPPPPEPLPLSFPTNKPFLLPLRPSITVNTQAAYFFPSGTKGAIVLNSRRAEAYRDQPKLLRESFRSENVTLITNAISLLSRALQSKAVAREFQELRFHTNDVLAGVACDWPTNKIVQHFRWSNTK